jgi:hypothetical protein
MNGARRLSAAALTVLAVAAGYLAAASTAGARPIPIPDRYTGAAPGPAPTVVDTHTGLPWWVFGIVAVAAAVLTLAATVTVARLRPPRRLQQA